jgi:hypothetical protein
MQTLSLVTVRALHMRSLISPLQSVINALLNGQLSRAKLFFALGHAHAYLSAFAYLAPTKRYQRLA